jgi:hypothetical protein
MALPSSGPLSINDIRVELGQSQANSSLRSLSNIAGFSTPDAISEFYGYSPSASIFLIEPGVENSGEACSAEGGEFELWWEGPGCPAITNTLYTDPGLTTPFDGKNLWWRSLQCNAIYYIMSNGFIEGYGDCG